MTDGPLQQQLRMNLITALRPSHLQLINESHMHAGPAKESHFKVVVVSEAFSGKNRVARHRMVNKAVAAELDAGLHALAIHAFDPEQWAAEQAVPDSPLCAGGSKG